MSVSFNKSGIIYASGSNTLIDESGDTISNTYNYSHGFIEDNSSSQAMSIHEDYVLTTEFTEY